MPATIEGNLFYIARMSLLFLEGRNLKKLLGNKGLELPFTFNGIESILFLEPGDHGLGHFLEFRRLTFRKVGFLVWIIQQVVQLVLVFPLVTVDQFPIPLAKGGEIRTPVRVGEVTHEMIGPIGVFLA